MEALVTGASGLIGRWLVLELSKRGRPVGACMRRAAAREEAFLSWIESRGGQRERVTCLEFDMESTDNPWRGEAMGGVRDVFHTAALFQFGLSRERAMSVNVDGGLRVVRWAASLPRLLRFVMVGGYRLRSSELLYLQDVEALSEQEIDVLYRRHGAYEASKFVEYVALRAEAKTLGVAYNVVHPSTVIGHSETGETNQFLAFAQSVKELVQGKMPALLGNERVFLPLLTVDFLAAFMASLVELDDNEGEEYCLLDQKTPMFHDLLRLIGAHLKVNVPRLKLPLWFVKRLPRFIVGENKEALTFLTEDTYDTALSEQRAAEMGLRMPALEPALMKWLDFLVASNFGA